MISETFIRRAAPHGDDEMMIKVVVTGST